MLLSSYHPTTSYIFLGCIRHPISRYFADCCLRLHGHAGVSKPGTFLGYKNFLNPILLPSILFKLFTESNSNPFRTCIILEDKYPILKLIFYRHIVDRTTNSKARPSWGCHASEHQDQWDTKSLRSLFRDLIDSLSVLLHTAGG